jgi:uncharacterized protein (TIGR03067 family)
MSLGYRLAALFLSLVAPAAALAGDKSPQDELAKLRGTWLTVSLVNNGEILVDDKTKLKSGSATTLVYDADTWKVQVGDRTVAKGKFKVDTAKMPKEIDVFDESGETNERTKLGIYEIRGGSYRFCLAPAGKPRPTEFSSKPGSGHSLGVSRRARP